MRRYAAGENTHDELHAEVRRRVTLTTRSHLWPVVPGTGVEAHPMGDAKPLPDEADELLMPSQVVRRFRVDPKTITRWTRAGKLDPITTPGGHRRFRASDIQRCLQENTHDEGPKQPSGSLCSPAPDVDEGSQGRPPGRPQGQP